MRLLCLIIILGLASGCSQNQSTHDVPPVTELIPSLEEMSSVWISKDTLAIRPTLRNQRAQAILNNDMTSVSWFASAPYSGGYHTGTMKVNGHTVLSSEFKWSVFGAERKTDMDSITIHSTTRMVFEENGILWKVRFKNNTNKTLHLRIDQDVIGFISRYDTDWQWWYPTPSIRFNSVEKYEDNLIGVFLENLHETKKVRDDIGINSKENPVTDSLILSSDLYTTQSDRQSISVSDNNSEAETVFTFHPAPDKVQEANSGATVSWDLEIPAGSEIPIQMVMSFGDKGGEVREKAANWLSDFEGVFSNIQSNWQDRWIKLFTPGNDFVSGNFPILDTDDEHARRVYYNSPLTMLYLTHTNFPVLDRVVLTGGPRWGPSIMFYWDTTSWRTIGSVTDPEMMKENLLGWLTIDINKYYGRDYFGGKGVGNGYVANYWAIFQMLHEYLAVTGDYDFLEETVNDITILEHMHKMAYNWENLVKQGQEGYEGELYSLADFGDNPWLLLEAVPTYIHIIPSFNAGYVGMMKSLSDMYKKLGREEEARKVENDASQMAKLILQLYADDGTWYSLFPDNKKVEIRHALDFHFIGRYMSEDLTYEMKEEMVEFLEEELLTDTWMRAQSLSDPAAKDSDRPDHGPLGAYDGWPLNTMEALYHMGYPEKAMDFYRDIYPVTLEGNWAQAHELWGENKEDKNASVRIAERGWHVRDAASGIGFANVMLREFFGFMPGFMEDDPLDQPEMVRSIQGKMYHVLYQGEYYTITSNDEGLKMEKER